jgi:hypothetical protein
MLQEKQNLLPEEIPRGATLPTKQKVLDNDE